MFAVCPEISMAFSTFYHIVCVKYKPFEAFIFKFCASIKESNAFGREQGVQGEGIMEMEEEEERGRDRGIVAGQF